MPTKILRAVVVVQVVERRHHDPTRRVRICSALSFFSSHSSLIKASKNQTKVALRSKADKPVLVAQGYKWNSCTATLMGPNALGSSLDDRREGNSSRYNPLDPTGGQWLPYRAHDLEKALSLPLQSCSVKTRLNSYTMILSPKTSFITWATVGKQTRWNLLCFRWTFFCRKTSAATNGRNGRVLWPPLHTRPEFSGTKVSPSVQRNLLRNSNSIDGLFKETSRSSFFGLSFASASTMPCFNF